MDDRDVFYGVMKISFIGPFGFHPNKTMRSRAMPLARAMVAAGHHVQIAMPPWQTPAEADRRWHEDGVELIYVAVNGGIVQIVRRLLREVALFQPDVVHTFKPKAYAGLVAWWLYYRGRIGSPRPLLVTDTDDWEGWGGWNDRADYTIVQKYFFAWQERWGYGHHDGLTVASRALEALALEHNVLSKKVLYLPNGPGIGTPDQHNRAATRSRIGLGSRPTILLYSRLFEFNLDRLIAILAKVKHQLPDVAILSIGAGLFAADAADLRNRFDEAGLLEAVIELGWQEESALPDLVAAADVGIYLMDDDLLNRTKCPVKLADMIRCGLSVVGEDVGQVGQYIKHGQSGRLRPTGDIDGLAADLLELLTKPLLRQQYGQAARQHAADQFDWNRLATRLCDFYVARHESSALSLS